MNWNRSALLGCVVVGVVLQCSIPRADADTLYWGGGSNNITGPHALPTELGNLSGAWNTTVQNWGVDTSGSSYQVWPDSGGLNTAFFGSGLATDATTPATVTLGSDITVNRLDVRDPANGLFKTITFDAAAPVTVTLNGVAPSMNVQGNIFFAADYKPNLSWAGTAGLKFNSSSIGLITIEGDASQLTGPIAVDITGYLGNVYFGRGSKLGSTDIRIQGGLLHLQSANGANNTAFADTAAVFFLGNSAIFCPEAYAGATPSTETIGKLVLQCGYGTIHAPAGGWNGSGGSGTKGKFILGDATAGVDRGSYGKGMMGFNTEAADVIRTDLVVSNGVATGVLPWALSSLGRLVQLDSNKVLKVFANADAPTDVTTWVADADYRLTNAPAGTRTTLTLNSLAAYLSGNYTLTMGSGEALTLTRGLLGLQRTGGATSLTVTGGTLTTPAGTLYVNMGTIPGTININSQLAGTFDVVFGGSGGSATMGGTDPNTYVGTTYVACSVGLIKPTASAPAIPGDLVVLSGNLVFGGYYTQNQIARTANVIIEELGSMTGSGNGGSQDFGGNVTINGGTFLGNFGNSHHAFDASGIGLRFNGGRLGCNTPAGYGNYYLLTDVSYASASTKQAVFENTSASQLLNLAAAGKGAAVRTFAITNSATLDAVTPEMVVYMALTEANTTEKAGLTKTGSGALSVRGMTYNLTGDITVNDGVLVSAGSWTAATRTGATVSGSAVVTGLSTTGDLVVGQRVTGTGIPATTTIFNIDSATQITLSQNVTAGGTPSLAFAGRGGMGKAQVLLGVRTSGSPVITGLDSTASLAVGQPVSGIGVAGSILSIDSSSQITLSANATSSGTSDIAFPGGSAVGSGPVTVNNGGTLMGDGIAGNVTVNSGGTLVPGTPENPMGNMAIGGNLSMSGGGTMAVNISDTAQNTVVVRGNAVLGGSLTVTPVNGYRLPNDAGLNLLTVTGTISGQFTSVTAGYEVKVVGNQLVLSRKLKGLRYKLK